MERKLSQRDLGKYLKAAPSTIAMYELGQREPDFETVSRMADYFGVATDYLLGQTDVRAKPTAVDLSSRWPSLSPDRRQRAYEVERALKALTGAERVFAKGTTNEAFDAMAESLESFLQLLLTLNEKPDHS